MSQLSAAASLAASASSTEKHASSSAFDRTPSSAPVAPKLRSCVVCRNRKVRCDKQSPCSNCRRAKIPCVFSSTERPPRWARRLDRLTNNVPSTNAPGPPDADPGVEKVMERLLNLENLVQELRHQLEQTHASASSTGGGSSEVNSPESSIQVHDGEQLREHGEQLREQSPATDTSSVRKQFGRLVFQDASHSRYISSGFWSRVDDELDGLKLDTRSLAGDESDIADDEPSPGKISSNPELERTPSDRHGFLFQHNLNISRPKVGDFHPLPSQVPFLWDVFLENVNFYMRIVHVPSVIKMVRELRISGVKCLTPSNEALMFSIYYAAIVSMEEDDVSSSRIAMLLFKTDLILKYRLGLEHALAEADFLNVPNILLVQALTIFLFLARRHDSPRFVWMMTGSVVRMSQYLGLQRDGTHFKHLTPFEIEMRRRVWWAVCMLDLRASEDQAMDLTITGGSFDTKIPLNINDADITPESKQLPTERYGITDMSFERICAAITEIMRQMMARGAGNDPADLEDQSLSLNRIYQKFEEEYLQFTTESGNITYWVAVTVARITMAKMALIVFLPVLFSSPGEHISDEIRTKLLVSAIEVAEYNHALNAERACRHWRWIYQTYTHWHAIIYLAIETSRRPWSATVERAWVGLHSCWLIPAQNPIDKDLRIWIPLRKLMHKARKHRDAELTRLRADPQEAAMLEMEDHQIPLPSSSGPFPTGSSVEKFRERWRQLVATPSEYEHDAQASGSSGTELVNQSINASYAAQPTPRLTPGHDARPDTMSANIYSTANRRQTGRNREITDTDFRDSEPAAMTDTLNESAWKELDVPSLESFPSVPTDWSDGRTMGPGFVPWLWADADPSIDVFSNMDVDPIYNNMDFDREMDWYNWLESAQVMEREAMPSGNDQT
ncbi:MAG: hypothetical protein Q9160_006886 [Pyrenula sp. 1 TL-2023]